MAGGAGPGGKEVRGVVLLFSASSYVARHACRRSGPDSGHRRTAPPASPWSACPTRHGRRLPRRLRRLLQRELSPAGGTLVPVTAVALHGQTIVFKFNFNVSGPPPPEQPGGFSSTFQGFTAYNAIGFKCLVVQGRQATF